MSLGVESRELGALDAPAGLATAERIVAAADRAAVPRVDAVVAAMAELPVAADGVDLATLAALSSTPQVWSALLADQKAQAAAAEDTSRRGDRLVVALLLGALASSLAAVAGTRPRPGVAGLYAPVALLLGALAMAAGVLLV